MVGAGETSGFRIDLANLCLWRHNGAAAEERLDLAPKTFDVLRYLADHAGRLVTHDELLTALWRDVHVQPEVLKTHILSIRSALGDKSSDPRFIETQRGRGYRFIGQINGLASAAESYGAATEANLLAGRAETLRGLHALLQRAAAGERQAAFVNGEPGIGKTALVQRLIAETRHIPGLVVAQGHCIEGFGGIEPYYPVLEALGGLCSGHARAATIHALSTLAPAWAAQMPQIPVEQRSGAQLLIDGARTRMVREGTNLLEALAAERPLLLVLEDLHWADYATVDLLSALCRRRSAAKLMLIVTYRTEELKSARHPLKQMAHELAAHKYCHEIALGPLSEPAITEILAGGPDGGPISEELTKFIKGQSGGNPLFIGLILEFLQQRGTVERAAHGWRLLAPIGKHDFEMPPTIGRLLQSKMERMPDEALRILEAASVAGIRFDATTVAPAAGMDKEVFEAICDECSRNTFTIRRDELLILPDGSLARTYVFTHALYRAALYDGTGQSRRAHLHRAIGTRLEEIYPSDQRNDIAVRLAEHFAAAGDWARALDYLRSALRVATARFARHDALTILDCASALADHLPDGDRDRVKLELLERRGVLLASAFDPRARELCTQLVDMARLHGDIDVQCRSLIGTAYLSSWYDLEHSRSALEQVLALAEQITDPIRRDVIRMSAYYLRFWGLGWHKSDAARCQDAFNRLKEKGDSLSVARAQICFSMVCIVSTRYREAHELVDAGFMVLRDNTDPQVEIDLVPILSRRVRRGGEAPRLQHRDHGEGRRSLHRSHLSSLPWRSAIPCF
jgi:predicted ATPase/DNA-binding winged helix-turn-helix (wHTH) protein